MSRLFSRIFGVLIILLFLSGPSFSTGEGPVIWSFSAKPERYFSAFFEIHLKRIFSSSQVRTIHLYSPYPSALQKNLTPDIAQAQILIVLDFSPELFNYLIQEVNKISFQHQPFVIPWNSELEYVPESLHFVPIKILWDPVFRKLSTLLPDPSVPIFLAHQKETYIQSFIQSFQKRFPHVIITENFEPDFQSSRQSFRIISNDTYLKDNLSSLNSCICLESSTLALAKLQDGSVSATIDFKPSRLASQVYQLFIEPQKELECKLTLTPILILPDNLPQADAYETLSRCFMCGRSKE